MTLIQSIDFQIFQVCLVFTCVCFVLCNFITCVGSCIYLHKVLRKYSQFYYHKNPSHFPFITTPIVPPHFWVPEPAKQASPFWEACELPLCQCLQSRAGCYLGGQLPEDSVEWMHIGRYHISRSFISNTGGTLPKKLSNN